MTSAEKAYYMGTDMNCGGACLLKVHVKDGVVTRLETDDGDEPQLRNCLRCRAYRQRIYAPDRILYPLKRVGERGEGKFERVSWDDALTEIADAMSTAFPAIFHILPPVLKASFSNLIWSPGTTGFLNLTLSIETNKISPISPISPLSITFGIDKRASTPPTCAIASMISTPGIIGLPGKWP